VTTSTQNLQFLEALIANAERLKTLLGEDWLFFREHLLSIQARLQESDNEEEISEGVNDVVDLLIDTPAGDLVRELLAASGETGETTRAIDPTGQSHGEPSLAPAGADRMMAAVSTLGTTLEEPEASQDYVTVRVFYGTDRERAKKGFYNGNRGKVELGVADVTVPTNRAIGSLPKPRWWKLELHSNPAKHVTVVSAEPRDPAAFSAALRSAIGAADVPAVLVFVHGYNVTFTDAARRCAQLAVDLDYPGVPFLYSWPSVGRTLWYRTDETNVDWTIPHLEHVLRLVAGDVGARHVDVVAHSMGNRAVVGALRELPSRPDGPAAAIRHVVLAAPDIDAGTFREIAAKLTGRAERYTLYASSRDRALWLSKLVHGYPRAGDSGDELVIVADVLDTIDSTALDTSLLGHSYYGDRRSIISDIFSLFEHGTAPPRFGMSAMRRDGAPYWLLRP